MRHCKVCEREASYCCSGCLGAYYCGEDCQRRDWADHCDICQEDVGMRLTKELKKQAKLMTEAEVRELFKGKPDLPSTTEFFVIVDDVLGQSRVPIHIEKDRVYVAVTKRSNLWRISFFVMKNLDYIKRTLARRWRITECKKIAKKSAKLRKHPKYNLSVYDVPGSDDAMKILERLRVDMEKMSGALPHEKWMKYISERCSCNCTICGRGERSDADFTIKSSPCSCRCCCVPKDGDEDNMIGLASATIDRELKDDKPIIELSPRISVIGTFTPVIEEIALLLKHPDPSSALGWSLSRYDTVFFVYLHELSHYSIDIRRIQGIYSNKITYAFGMRRMTRAPHSFYFNAIQAFYIRLAARCGIISNKFISTTPFQAQRIGRMSHRSQVKEIMELLDAKTVPEDTTAEDDGIEEEPEKKDPCSESEETEEPPVVEPPPLPAPSTIPPQTTTPPPIIPPPVVPPPVVPPPVVPPPPPPPPVSPSPEPKVHHKHKSKRIKVMGGFKALIPYSIGTIPGFSENAIKKVLSDDSATVYTLTNKRRELGTADKFKEWFLGLDRDKKISSISEEAVEKFEKWYKKEGEYTHVNPDLDVHSGWICDVGGINPKISEQTLMTGFSGALGVEIKNVYDLKKSLKNLGKREFKTKISKVRGVDDVRLVTKFLKKLKMS